MILRKLTFLAVLLALAWPVASKAQAPGREARFAFVIGSDAYAQAPLKTAANDAALIADTLQAAGFAVTGARNLDQDTFRASYREFLEKAAAAGPDAVVAIYLSGYGVQFEGENYYLPADAQIARESDIPIAAIRISDLTRPLNGLAAKTRFTVLDIAYENPPLPRSLQIAPGLALVEADPGSLLAYNAAPGTFAPPATQDYGPYAQALAEAMHEPGLSLDEIFARTRLRVSELTKGRATPWEDSKLSSPFVLFERTGDAPAPRVSQAQLDELNAKPIGAFPVEDAYAAALRRDTIAGYEEFVAAFPSSPFTKEVRGLLAARREALTWRRTTAVNSPEAYWSYLRRYPRGPHGADARRRLARLSAPAQPPSDFAVIEYDVPPPPSDEAVYFEEPEVVYYDQAFVSPPPPVAFLPPPPPWWSPPPVVEDEETYYLWTPRRETRPDWMHAPRFVEPPAPPVYQGGNSGPSIAPYVAIPAAVAAGIVAGRLLNRRLDAAPQRPGARSPGAPPQNRQPRPVLAPVSAPPANVSGRQPGGVVPVIPNAPAGRVQTPGQPPVRQGSGPQGPAAGSPPPPATPNALPNVRTPGANQTLPGARPQNGFGRPAPPPPLPSGNTVARPPSAGVAQPPNPSPPTNGGPAGAARQQQIQQQQERARQQDQQQLQQRRLQQQQQDQQRLQQQQQQDRARQQQDQQQRQQQLQQQQLQQDRARQQQDQQRQQQDRARQQQEQQQRQQQQQLQQDRARQQQDQQRQQQQQQLQQQQQQQRQQQQIQQQGRARQQQEQQQQQQRQQQQQDRR